MKDLSYMKALDAVTGSPGLQGRTGDPFPLGSQSVTWTPHTCSSSLHLTGHQTGTGKRKGRGAKQSNHTRRCIMEDFSWLSQCERSPSECMLTQKSKRRPILPEICGVSSCLCLISGHTVIINKTSLAHIKQ